MDILELLNLLFTSSLYWGGDLSDRILSLVEAFHALIQLSLIMHLSNLRPRFFFPIIHNRDRFEWIFLTIFKLAIQIELGKLVITKLAILAVTEQDYLLTGHTVEFDINSFSVIFFRVQNN